VQAVWPGGLADGGGATGDQIPAGDRAGWERGVNLRFTIYD